MSQQTKRATIGPPQRIGGENMKPTVASNHTRIVRIEEDLGDLEERVDIMDRQFTDVMARLDTILKIGRGIAVMVAASLGFDLGIEGGMI